MVSLKNRLIRNNYRSFSKKVYMYYNIARDQNVKYDFIKCRPLKVQRGGNIG